jgi:hypothetical protein
MFHPSLRLHLRRLKIKNTKDIILEMSKEEKKIKKKKNKEFTNHSQQKMMSKNKIKTTILLKWCFGEWQLVQYFWLLFYAKLAWKKEEDVKEGSKWLNKIWISITHIITMSKETLTQLFVFQFKADPLNKYKDQFQTHPKLTTKFKNTKKNWIN